MCDVCDHTTSLHYNGFLVSLNHHQCSFLGLQCCWVTGLVARWQAWLLGDKLNVGLVISLVGYRGIIPHSEHINSFTNVRFWAVSKKFYLALNVETCCQVELAVNTWDMFWRNREVSFSYISSYMLTSPCTIISLLILFPIIACYCYLCSVTLFSYFAPFNCDLEI